MKTLKRAIIRSTFFNLAFYAWTAVACIVFLPGLLLPRRFYLWIVSAWIAGCTFLEKNLLNLHYEIRGLEHLPASGSYIAACKHQSPYETVKLRVLFEDPAIVLKKELLSIPFWGWFLKKSDVIAIDRSTPDQAFASFERGALRMRDQGRPIVIFPQGTRVWPDETPAEKPYRSGVARVQASTGLPIVPMALNSGMFWPRQGWLKSPGTVTFEFLQTIPPGGEKDAIMRDVQTRVESASRKLCEEALNRPAPKNRLFFYFWLLLGLFAAYMTFALYTSAWFAVADQIDAIRTQKGVVSTQAHITGYPGPMNIYIKEISLQTDKGEMIFHDLNIRAWTLPFFPVRVQSKAINVRSPDWREPLAFSDLNGSYTWLWHNRTLRIHEARMAKDDFGVRLNGTLDFNGEFTGIDLKAELDNYQSMLLALERQDIIESKDVFLTAAALSLFARDGIATIPITQREGSVYAGPLKLGRLPPLRPQEGPGAPKH